MKSLSKILILLFYGFSLTASAQMQTPVTISLPNINFGLPDGSGGYSNYPPANLLCRIYKPSDYATNTKPCALIIDVGGTSNGSNGAVASAIGTDHVNLSYVISPLTRDTFHFIVANPYDTAGNGNEPPRYTSYRQIILRLRSLYNIDSTRIYLAGWSQGAGEVRNAASTSDTIGATISAVLCMSATNSWVPQYYYGTSPIFNNGQYLNRQNVVLWHTHGVHDGVVAYSQGSTYRDSITKYVAPTLYHFTSFNGGINDTHGNWDHKTLDTLGFDLSFWNWSDGSTLGAGGKPFYGSIYNWFLLFRNKLTPGGNASNLTAMSQTQPNKSFPVITGSVNYKRLHEQSVSLHASKVGEGDRDCQESFDH